MYTNATFYICESPNQILGHNEMSSQPHADGHFNLPKEFVDMYGLIYPLSPLMVWRLKKNPYETVLKVPAETST